MSELLKGAFSGPKIDLLTKQIDFKSPIITSQKVEDEEEKSKLQADKIDSPPLTAFQLKVKAISHILIYRKKMKRLYL